MEEITIREVASPDYEDWRRLWDGYNAFYGRVGPTALAEEITRATWERILHPEEPVHALVADKAGRIVGIAHYILHRSTSRLTNVCYLQDLYTDDKFRGLGVGRRLIESVYQAAKDSAVSRVYWQTQSSNQAGRALYEKLAKHRGFIVYDHEL